MTTATAKKKAPPQQEVEPEFVFPKMDVMTFVEVTTTLDWSEFAGGIVLKTSDRTADVWMIAGGYEGGMTMLPDCIHADDPWIKERPAMFEDGDRGIFRLAKSEKMMRLIFDSFTQTNATIEALVARIAVLEEAANIKPPKASRSQKPADTNGESPAE